MRGAQLKMYDETLEPVAQTFLSAGSGDFLVPSFSYLPTARNWKVPLTRRQECLRYERSRPAR